MGASNQVIVFVFFGQKYMEQFKSCMMTMPDYWNVKVINDIYGHVSGNIEFIQIPTPKTVYDMLTYRMYIDKHVKIRDYSAVWYSDPDILFKGDIIDKYRRLNKVMVSHEPNCPVNHPCMTGGFSDEEVALLVQGECACINGGFYAVPKSHYSFFEQYRTLCKWFRSRWPDDHSTDQHVLNNLFHRNITDMDLFDVADVCFRPDETGVYGMVNHYIGMHSEKVELMKNELKKINAN